ncbi:MAG: hypothetical protein ACR2PR_02530 [Pseudohongiellaceae bacterium]
MSNKKIKHVEGLDNFPFRTFQEFKNADWEGIAQPGVDRGVALRWAYSGSYTSGILRAQVFSLMSIPYIAILGFVVWVIISKSWPMLLGLPVLLFGFCMFHPSAVAFGIIRWGFIGLSFIGLAYAFMTDRPGLLALCLALVAIWYGEKMLYRKAVSSLIKAATEHEDLLCILWQGKALNVRFLSGDHYWVHWKMENGQSTHY